MQKCGRCTNGPGHDVPRDHSLYCKPCHKRICFQKLLQLGMHSTDALLLMDPSMLTLHKRHLEAQKAYNDGLASVKKAEKSGASSDYHNLLVATAIKYATCWPAQADRTSLGFYDLGSQAPQEDGPSVDHSVSLCYRDKRSMTLIARATAVQRTGRWTERGTQHATSRRW